MTRTAGLARTRWLATLAPDAVCSPEPDASLTTVARVADGRAGPWWMNGCAWPPAFRPIGCGAEACGRGRRRPLGARAPPGRLAVLLARRASIGNRGSVVARSPDPRAR